MKMSRGEEGMLLVRGSNVFSAYWQAPEKTAESFVHDALGRRWFVTGDLARQEPSNGYVTLLGRSHELIISGGFNIYPREIEEVLETFDGVAEAAVVGRPDAEWGEVPVAYLVCEMLSNASGAHGLLSQPTGQLQSAQEFVIVDELPRNAMGKLQKHRLSRIPGRYGCSNEEPASYQDVRCCCCGRRSMGLR
jgi:malonyl-CoA/methylmalonyl-CoA synthetase